MNAQKPNYYDINSLKDQYVTDYVDGQQVVGPLRWKRESGIPHGYFHDHEEPRMTSSAALVMVAISAIIFLTLMSKVTL